MRQREWASFCWLVHSPNCLWCLRLSQAETRSPELDRNLFHGCQGPSYLGRTLCQKSRVWSQMWNLNPFTLIGDVGLLTSVLTINAKYLAQILYSDLFTLFSFILSYLFCFNIYLFFLLLKKDSDMGREHQLLDRVPTPDHITLFNIYFFERQSDREIEKGRNRSSILWLTFHMAVTASIRPGSRQDGASWSPTCDRLTFNDLN